MESKELEKKYVELNSRLNNMEKNNNRILNSYNDLFNSIFIDYELKPKGLLKYRLDLLTEMLTFIDKICKKHDIKWWLNYGTLLGAYRHGSFIPWDDDVDISMTRKDFNKFLKIINDEITENDLEDCLYLLNGYPVRKDFIISFPSLICCLPSSIKENALKFNVYNLGFIDIFPFDYAVNSEKINDQIYTDLRDEFYVKSIKGIPKKELINEYYDKLDLSLNETGVLIPGFDGAHGLNCDYNLIKYKTEDIFPLKTISFNNRKYYCPNNTKKYLEEMYGKNFMKVPKIIHHHNALSNSRLIEHISEGYEEQISKLKLFNSSEICNDVEEKGNKTKKGNFLNKIWNK